MVIQHQHNYRQGDKHMNTPNPTIATFRSKIETFRSKIERSRGASLKEQPTKTTIIEPVLDALGWDTRDHDEVQTEFSTSDGKSADYALKINGKPVLLIEAKALNDPLTEVKDIAQVVAYAATEGIVWCVLTNGVKWKVYCSLEAGKAADKMMFEVTLDSRESNGLSIQQLSEQLWRFSRAGMTTGALDELRDLIFTDKKVQRALDAIMLAVPVSFVDRVKNEISDKKLSSQQIRESVIRIWGAKGNIQTSTPSTNLELVDSDSNRQVTSSAVAAGGRLRTKSFGNERVTCLDGAAKVLAESGVPMRCGDMMAGMIEARYWNPTRGGKTPAATLQARILKEGRSKGQQSRFMKVGRGLYALTDYGKQSVS
jgi:predicted type IV restriction endonuclease